MLHGLTYVKLLVTTTTISTYKDTGGITIISMRGVRRSSTGVRTVRGRVASGGTRVRGELAASSRTKLSSRSVRGGMRRTRRREVVFMRDGRGRVRSVIRARDTTITGRGGVNVIVRGQIIPTNTMSVASRILGGLGNMSTPSSASGG